MKSTDLVEPSAEFLEDWKRWHGDREPGRFAHWCWDWDFLPVDEHSVEASSCHDVEYDEEARNNIAQAEAEFEQAEAEFKRRAPIDSLDV